MWVRSFTVPSMDDSHSVKNSRTSISRRTFWAGCSISRSYSRLRSRAAFLVLAYRYFFFLPATDSATHEPSFLW